MTLDTAALCIGLTLPLKYRFQRLKNKSLQLGLGLVFQNFGIVFTD